MTTSMTNKNKKPKMSEFDSEINLLEFRLQELKEKKKQEEEKKLSPLNNLEELLNKNKKIMKGTTEFSRSRYFKAQERIEFLEPIYLILNSFHERLSKLEK